MLKAEKAAGEVSPALVLFDIDGTLIRRAGPHHREALVEAVQEGRRLESTTDNIPVQGMLRPGHPGHHDAKRRSDERPIRRPCPNWCGWRNGLRPDLPDLQKKVCPGVRRVLAGLERRGVPTGLVTGNLTRIAWKKMERRAETVLPVRLLRRACERSCGTRAPGHSPCPSGEAGSTPAPGISLIGDHPTNPGSSGERRPGDRRRDRS